MKSYINIIIFFTIFGIVKGIEISLHGFVYGETELHKTLVEKTNAYMKEKGLDITLKKDFVDLNSDSGDPNHIANFIEESLMKKENGYDLYLTDTVYTGRFAKHFEDLNNYVDKNVIDLYKDGTATKTCFVDDRLVGLPLSIDYGGLYANMDLLNKYNRKVPETWDELIETINFIYENESPSNPELHKYLAHVPDYETGFGSIIEYIHSFRDSATDNFPGFTSENAVAALNKMKEIREFASSEDEFHSNEGAIFGSLFSGNFILLRAWYVGEKFGNYTVSFNPLPGKVKGVSASCIGGSNISMNIYISEERKKAAGEVLSFINSFEEQKFGILSSNLRSAIYSTYKDKEVCEKIDCIKFSSIQSIVRPSSQSINYEQYSEKFRELVRSYISGETDKSAMEILKEAEDVRKIHYVEINSIPSIIFLSASVITLILLLTAYIYVSIKHFKNQFVFLPFKYWIIIIIGISIMASYGFTGLNELSNYKCLIRPFLLSMGFDLIYTPLFLKMITIFPSKNGLSKFVKDHFTLVFMLFLIIDILFNIAWYLLDPLMVNKLVIASGKNFQYCSSSGFIGGIFKNVMFALKLITLVIMSVLVFTEWNLASFKADIRSITSTIYTNILIIGLFAVLEKLNINNVYLYFGFRASLVLIFCLSTLIILFGSKYYYISIKKETEFPDISTINKNTNSYSKYQSSNTYTMNNSQVGGQTKLKILNYHYQTGSTMDSKFVSKPYSALFSSNINNSTYNELFNNNSNENNQSQSTESFNQSKPGSRKNSLNNMYNFNNNSMNNYNNNNNNSNFNNNNFNNKNYNNNNYSNNNYSSSNYNSNNYSSNNYSTNNYSNNDYSNSNTYYNSSNNSYYNYNSSNKSYNKYHY